MGFSPYNPMIVDKINEDMYRLELAIGGYELSSIRYWEIL